MWPISKLKNVFISIDTQLRQQRQQLDEERQRIKKQEEQIAALRNEQKSIQELSRSIMEIQQQMKDNMLQQSTKLGCLEEAVAKSNNNIIKNISEIESSLLEHRQDRLNDHWMTKFGYDGLLSNLQLSVVEQIVPGNRKRLEALRNTHCGESCFVIGNGPSLRAEDLTRLYEKKVFSFASKRITAIFDATLWRPDVWMASDLDYIKLCSEEINALEGFTKMVPCQSLLNLNISISDAIYFPFIQAKRTPCWFNADVTKGVHFWGTVTCKMINMAVYMGFTNIYLLGVDHSYALKEVDGKYEYDKNAKNHFFSPQEDNQEERDRIDNIQEELTYMTKAFSDVKWYCDQLGVNIFNATRGGALEAFSRVKFDEILEENDL